MPLEFTRGSGARTSPANQVFGSASLPGEDCVSCEPYDCLVFRAGMRVERDHFAATYEMHAGEIVVAP